MYVRVLGGLLVVVLVAGACRDGGDDAVEVWSGPSHVEVVSVYGDTGCEIQVGQALLEHVRLPIALRERDDESTRMYLGRQPVEPPTALGAQRTGLRVNDWELWRWTPRTEPDGPYHYILVQDDAATDPILYQLADSGECDE